MNPKDIKQLLSEQPDSYLQHKDFNTFNTADLHCLRKGILVERKPVFKKLKGKRQMYSLLVTVDGVTKPYRYYTQVMKAYNVTKSIVEHGMRIGICNKQTMQIEKIPLIDEEY